MQWIKDQVLEARIHLALFCMMATKGRAARRVIADRMAALIRRRSPSQMERMENRKGLR